MIWMNFWALHIGAVCLFLVWWIYSCHSSKSTGLKTFKLHLCALVDSFQILNLPKCCYLKPLKDHSFRFLKIS